MNKEDFRFVPVTESIEIPVPKNCTFAEEQALVAEFKAKHDLAELEKEACELETAIREGNLVSADEVLKELGIATEASRKTA